MSIANVSLARRAWAIRRHALRMAEDRPRVTICDTKMCKGVPFLEDREITQFVRVAPDEWAKAGILGLIKATARELAPDNIRANAICPGYIEATDITGGMMTPDLLSQINAGIPMGRPGRVDEVAGCALFLASPLSSYVTGSEVDVNGGSLIH